MPGDSYHQYFIEGETGAERWRVLLKVTQLVKRQSRGVTVWLWNPLDPYFVLSLILKVSSSFNNAHLLLFFRVDFFFFFFPLEEGGGVKSLWREALWRAQRRVWEDPGYSQSPIWAVAAREEGPSSSEDEGPVANTELPSQGWFGHPLD